MEPTIHHLKHDPNERFIGNLPWKIGQMKNAKSGLTPRVDGTADNHCLCRPKYKLKNIGLAERLPVEQEDWSKVIDTAEKHARIRAVQMHMQNITNIPALSLSICPCDYSRPVSASAALRGLHTDEIDRTWIYDTGAGACFLGYAHLTANERKRRVALLLIRL